jgi:hypothetical protein
MNTALFEENLCGWLTVKVECFVLLLEYQLLRQTVINAMPYCGLSPSSKNNICSSGHWVAFQRDGLYTVAEGEGRAYLKYNIRSPRLSSSAVFEETFVNL